MSTPSQTTSLLWGFPAATVLAFDAAFLASQPTAVQQALNVTPGSPAFGAMTLQTAMTLAKQGYFIWYDVMVSGWDPYATMYQLQVDGYAAYYDATGTVQRPVSLNLGDYPAYVPPPPPGPPPFVSLVGANTGTKYVNASSPYNGWEMFGSNPGTNNSSVNAGGPYKLDPRGTFVKMVTQTPFGPEIFWVLDPMQVTVAAK